MKSSIFVLSTLLMASCVTQRKYEDMTKLKDEMEQSFSSCSKELDSMRVSASYLQNQNAELNKLSNRLRIDSSEMSSMYKIKTDLYADLDTRYQSMVKLTDAENQKLLKNLKELDEKLTSRQKELEQKETRLTTLSADLTKSQKDLKSREQKVAELQSVLDKKDSAVTALKNTLSNALLGYKDKGLTVEVRNGKVYVSLEEQLLFASASIVVDKRGKDALLQLAKVLEKQSDINILVEGHTDNVPMSSGQIKDNWDLSVLRATSIVRILTTEGKIDPKRFMASGRGEYFPLDIANTSDARKKNRRTEIILTPKLDELLKILESN